jgi:hypothetical protein
VEKFMANQNQIEIITGTMRIGGYLTSMIRGARREGWAVRVVDARNEIAVARREGERLMVLCGGDCPDALYAGDDDEAAALAEARADMLAGTATEAQIEALAEAERIAANEWGSEIVSGLINAAK